MKSFRTDFALTAEPFLELNQPILTLGSCFAEHIGQKLLDYKWQGLTAPFGTLFHPLALCKLMRLASEDADLDATLFWEHDAAFFHHDLHSQFYAKDPAALQLQWREVAAQVRATLQKAPSVFLTLGTAWVYQAKKSGQVVANCHKRPADYFHKRLLSAQEINEALEGILSFLPVASPLVISVSPVRHIRDSMIRNSLSKSLLLVQIHELAQKHPDRVRYFPAYEIMLDDLRDYRFYAADMIHPSTEAIEYIWEKFTKAYATDSTKQFLRRWQPVLTAVRHQPLRLDAPSYQKYLQTMLHELESFTDVDCSAEQAQIKSRLLSSSAFNKT